MCESPQSLVGLTTFEIHHLKNQRFCFDSSPWCWYLSIILQGEDIGRRFNKNNLREQRLCHANAGSKKNTRCYLLHFRASFQEPGGLFLAICCILKPKICIITFIDFSLFFIDSSMGVHRFFPWFASISRWFSSIVPYVFPIVFKPFSMVFIDCFHVCCYFPLFFTGFHAVQRVVRWFSSICRWFLLVFIGVFPSLSV